MAYIYEMPFPGATPPLQATPLLGIAGWSEPYRLTQDSLIRHSSAIWAAIITAGGVYAFTYTDIPFLYSPDGNIWRNLPFDTWVAANWVMRAKDSLGQWVSWNLLQTQSGAAFGRTTFDLEGALNRGGA
jgi:hypothetical protein